ncbi:hypothetical protein DTO164E3_6112 [Paecilomyces variotii]|nr:hypothetical protein DTO164E3_6112 [Paecilomyces variotii]KAJ9374259.1 hypothetical protein DTO282E5_1181 [Paecilomyces variotii]
MREFTPTGSSNAALEKGQVMMSDNRRSVKLKGRSSGTISVYCFDYKEVNGVREDQGGEGPFNLLVNRTTAIGKALLGQANWDSLEVAAELYYVVVPSVYIPGPNHRVADGLSRVLFSSKDCDCHNAVGDAHQELIERGPLWIWKDGIFGCFSDGYRFTFLRDNNESRWSEWPCPPWGTTRGLRENIIYTHLRLIIRSAARTSPRSSPERVSTQTDHRPHARPYYELRIGSSFDEQPTMDYEY